MGWSLKGVCKKLHGQQEKVDNPYNVQDELLYKMEKSFLVNIKRVQPIRETHTSKVVDHFGVGKDYG